MKIQHILFCALIATCLSACEKDGELNQQPIKKVQPIQIFGFALVDTLEQYFDGRKVRELSGRYAYLGKIAFDKEGPTVMEFKKKGDSKVIYSRTISPGDANTDKKLSFYYGGSAVTEKYVSPSPIVGVEQFAFYIDGPADMPVDIVYADASGDIDAVKYLARNVKPRTWTSFLQVPPIDNNGQELYIFLLKAGKKEWLAETGFAYSFVQANLPTTGGWYQGGGVQALYVQIVKDMSGTRTGEAHDLVQAYQ